MLSHGLPRSSGRLAQIRVSGFSLLYHRYISSQLRQDAITRSRSHTVRPTSWSGHRPCPKFTCPCPWCACLPLSDSCPGPYLPAAPPAHAPLALTTASHRQAVTASGVCSLLQPPAGRPTYSKKLTSLTIGAWGSWLSRRAWESESSRSRRPSKGR